MTMEEADPILNKRMKLALDKAKITFDDLQQEGKFDRLKFIEIITFNVYNIYKWDYCKLAQSIESLFNGRSFLCVEVN
jgi:hypothetical protein